MTDTSTSSPGETALLLGATGAVGSEVLTSLIASPHYTTIHSFVRKASSTPSSSDSKVVEHVVDFEKLCDGDASQVEKFKEVKGDSVLIALGTTRAAAGGAKPFERIDREYVLAAAKAARVEGGKPQKVVYCSAQMADSTSRFLYPK
jgi:oxidoreductase